MVKSIKIILSVFISLLMVFSCSSRASNVGVEFKQDKTNSKIDIIVDGRFFTSFIYSDTLEKSCLFPIMTPSGQLITRGYPLEPRAYERTDHPHHVGLWFNFGDVNGLDFWNNSSAIPPDRKKNYGSVTSDSIIEINPRKGELTTLSSWIDFQKNRLLSEKTTYIFSGVKNEYLSIERLTQLTAKQVVTLKGNKEGLIALRVDRAFETPDNTAVTRLDSLGNPSDKPFINNDGVNGTYRNHEGLTGEAEIWGKQTPWVALRADKNGEIITIVMLDHKKNPNYPAWPHARGYGLFSLNNLAGDAMDKRSDPVEVKLQPGEIISFRHKVIIGGDMSDEEINKYNASFQRTKII